MHYSFIALVACGYLLLGAALALLSIHAPNSGVLGGMMLLVWVLLQTLPSATFARRVHSGWVYATVLHAWIAHGIGILCAGSAILIVDSTQPDPPGMNLQHLWAEPDPWIDALQMVGLAAVYGFASSLWAVFVGAIAREVLGLGRPFPPRLNTVAIRNRRRLLHE